jgi:DNA-directed RNA polymerase subunit M/transcription elongation factor TFIIS
MPLVVKCRNCGNVIMDIRDADSFSNFNFLSLEGQKCNKCGHKFHIDNVKYDVYPFNQSNNNKEKEKKKVKKRFRIYVYSRIVELKTRKHPLYCEKCGEKFKVGDTVVSLNKGKYSRRFHFDCYKKIRALEVFVSSFKPFKRAFPMR